MSKPKDGMQPSTDHAELVEHLAFARRLAERQQTLFVLLILEFRSRELDAWPAQRLRTFNAALPKQLQQALRPLDHVETLPRPGAIAIIAGLHSLDELEHIIHRLRRVLIDATGLDDLRTSIGVAAYPFDNGSSEALLRAAEQTAIAGLAEGRHLYRYVNAELEAWRQTSSDLQQSLVRGLGRGEFEVRYRPVVAADTGTPLAIEALPYWRHPERGVLEPAEFIPAAERYAWLLRELDEWLLQEIAGLVLDDRCAASMKIAFDVRLAEISTDDFAVLLQRQLERYPHLAGDRLILRLPRHALRDERKRVESAIEALAPLGLQWALEADLDQFACGTIASLPLAWVMLDTRELRQCLEPAGERETLHALARLVRSLGGSPVFTQLQDAGAAQAFHGTPAALQGDAIAAPMPAPSLLRWLEGRNASAAAHGGDDVGQLT